MRELTVYNTLSRKKEVFKPVTPGQVKMYVCGITPYNHSHMGNARPFVTWDVIKRYLKHLGYAVTHIQNFILKSWISSTFNVPINIRAYLNTWMIL